MLTATKKNKLEIRFLETLNIKNFVEEDRVIANESRIKSIFLAVCKCL